MGDTAHLPDLMGAHQEPPPPPLDYMTEQRMFNDGWRKGRPPTDRDDTVGQRCWAWLAGGPKEETKKRCVRRHDHLSRPVPLPHIIVYAGADDWYKEVWGAGA